MSHFIEVDDKLLPIYGADKDYKIKEVENVIKIMVLLIKT